MSMNISDIQITVTSPELLPVYAKLGDAGADLCAAEDMTLWPGNNKLVRTGVSIALPENLVGLVHPRSGLALKHGITVLNTPGTIDSGYRGEIGVILRNTGNATFEVKRGDRIAQLVIQEYVRGNFTVVDSLPESERGDGGFGSTGIKSA
jgi:dUTP pyrophosphatase